jgi:hypothetical protein
LYAAYNADNNTNDALNTYNGTAIGGLTYSTGKINQAFQFNGTNSLVSLPTNSMKFTATKEELLKFAEWVLETYK